jgi:hypothetical protein
MGTRNGNGLGFVGVKAMTYYDRLVAKEEKEDKIMSPEEGQEPIDQKKSVDQPDKPDADEREEAPVDPNQEQPDADTGKDREDAPQRVE